MSNLPAWEIKETHPEIVEPLEQALRQVVDPEMGLNVVEMGLIREVSIDGEENNAHIVMIFTNPFCPFAAKMMENVRKTAEGVLDRSTTIEMGQERWDPTFMESESDANWGLF